MELASGDAATRVDLTARVDPDLRETDHHPTKEAQRKSGLGIAHPTLVFAQADIQRVMQAALDDPIAPLEFEEARGIKLVEGEAANEINDLGGFLTLAPNPPPQSRDGLDSRKAHLLRSDFLAIQHANFVSPPVVLPGHGVGARGGSRGKNAVG